jgi:glycosyltransferase involved in cell wall biosynthesis
VAKDLNVRLRSGWFSERSACYLAAGRPVITQSTGFEDVLPTGEGLFAFRDMDDILGAMAAIAADYERHSAAARRIAEECFRAETVLARLLADLGV